MTNKTLKKYRKRGMFAFTFVAFVVTIIILMGFVSEKERNYCEFRFKGDSMDCYYKILAEVTKEVSFCKQAKIAYYKESCYSDLFEFYQYASVCERVGDDLFYTDSCYKHMAIRKNDLSLCYKIKTQTQKDACQNSLAIKQLNVDLCEQIKEDYYKGMCYHEIGKSKEDISLCEKSGPYKDRCYWDIAVMDKNISYCNYVRKDWRQDCLNEVYGILRDF